MLAVVLDTFARIHWRHDFTGRAARVGLNDNTPHHTPRLAASSVVFSESPQKDREDGARFVGRG